VHTLLSDEGALHPLHGSLGWLARCGPALRELTLSNYAQLETPQHWQAALSGLTGLRSLRLTASPQLILRAHELMGIGAADGHATQLPAVFGTLTELTSLMLSEGPWTGLPPHLGGLVNLQVSCGHLPPPATTQAAVSTQCLGCGCWEAAPEREPRCSLPHGPTHCCNADGLAGPVLGQQPIQQPMLAGLGCAAP
jgi:hypothetical protein